MCGWNTPGVGGCKSTGISTIISGVAYRDLTSLAAQAAAHIITVIRGCPRLGAGVAMKMGVKIIQESPTGYRALCQALPGCEARASTKDEALRQVAFAIESYFVSLNISIPSSLQAVNTSP